MSITNEKFLTLYNQLNPEQKEAVDAIEGPVMVVAGPGTGKTQILTLRIANILLKTDVAPRNILALTFSESGAAAMRYRLANIIGAPAYSVVINTFHGFCNEIIKNYPEEFPLIIGANNITEVEQIQILKDLIIETPLEYLKPFGDNFYFLRPILQSINQLKREGVSIEKFKIITENEQKNFDQIPDLYHEKGAHKGKMKGDYQKQQKNIYKNKELSIIYSAYQDKLAENKLYDYSDMIMEVLSALGSNKDLLLILQEEHQYILVDEHQDTNNAQNKILELLCNFHKSPNVFFVGDEKQAIFRFQGASLENFLYFKTLYPDAKLITLQENYRSTENILNASHSLLPSPKPLKANAIHANCKIKIYEFIKPETELYFLCQDIAEKIKSGVSENEIAILYRDNRDAHPVARMLDKFGVPYIVRSDQDIMADIDIKKFIVLLKAIHNFGSPEHLVAAMHIDFLKIEPLDIYKLIEYSNRNHVGVAHILENKLLLEPMALTAPESIFKFYNNLKKWSVMSHNQNLIDFFEEILRESGFLAHLLTSDNPIEKIEKLEGLFDEVKTLVERRKATLKDFLEYLEVVSEHKVLLKKSSSLDLAKRVKLMTAHKSKGLEFEFVYIINAYDGHWGNKRKVELLPLPLAVFALAHKDISKKIDDENADERRLFYVAMTRAKKEVCITYAVELERGGVVLPSQFIGEINVATLEIKSGKAHEEKLALNREIIFAAPIAKHASLRDQDFIKEIFVRNGFSVTALNNYLKCPWQYFYMNLLRIPKAPSKHQMYGTAMHAALKDLFDSLAEREPSKDFLLAKFEHYLKQQPLTKEEFEESFNKGTRSLSLYFDAYSKTWTCPTLTEFNIPGVLLSENVRLTGKIDKMEIIGDGNQVNVVDYKTGKPKTRGEIEGTTANSEGDMKRQLIFYKLLLDKYENGKYKMQSGEIDFVEPDDKGRHRKERFIISDEEVRELEALILRSAHEILEVSFWGLRCGDQTCKYCELRDMM